MNLVTFGTVAASVKPLADLAKSLSDLVGSGKGHAEALQFCGQIIAAHESAIAAQAAQAEPLKEKDRLECLGAGGMERREGTRRAGRCGPGGPPYALKAEARGTEIVHHLCADFCQQGEQSYLMAFVIPERRAKGLRCNQCGAECIVQRADLGKSRSNAGAFGR